MKDVQQIDYLPLGSIVILRGGTQKVVINARGLIAMKINPPCFFDYGGSLYPQGITGDQILYFNHQDIIKVIYKGYTDEEDELMKEQINQWFAESEFERGNPAEIRKQESKHGR